MEKKKKIKPQILSAGSNSFGCLCQPWDDNSTLPSSVVGLHRNSIKSFSTGSFHCVAARDDGSVFGWGYNEDSQIGFQTKIENKQGEIVEPNDIDSDNYEFNNLQIYTKPTQITYFSDSVKIVKVKCGLDFTLFLSDTGEVYIASKKNDANSIEKLHLSDSNLKCINIFGNYIPWVLCENGSIYRIFKYAKDITKFQFNLDELANQPDHTKDIVSIREGSVLLIT